MQSLPRYALTGQREDWVKQARAKGVGSPTKTCCLGEGVSLSDAGTLFLARASWPLSQSDCKRSYLTRGPMGIIPSGMIPHWESTATSNQHIQISCSSKGFRAKRGNMGGCHLALTTHILTLPLRPHGSPMMKTDNQDANWQQVERENLWRGQVKQSRWQTTSRNKNMRNHEVETRQKTLRVWSNLANTKKSTRVNKFQFRQRTLKIQCKEFSGKNSGQKHSNAVNH